MNSQDLLATDERNQDSLRNLLRALSLSQSQFSLILACSNYSSLRLAVIEQLNLLSEIKFQEIVLEKKSEYLYETIKKNLGEEIPKGVIICGLELVENLEVLLKATNNARDEFRKDFPFPIVLWVTDEVETQLRRKAQDFANWVCTPIEFNLGTVPLIELIEETTDELFSAILAVGSGKYIDSIPSSRRREVRAALGDLQQRGVELESGLAASLEFFLGQDTSLSREESCSYYERSLQIFGEAENGEFGEKIGCVSFYLGLWWRQHAIENRADYENSCEVAKNYFQQSITHFRQSNRPDLVAKFINSLGEVLQRLEQWEELAILATESLTLHQQYHEPIRLAHDYGLLADIALAKQDWHKAKENIEKALSIQAEMQRHEDEDLDWVWQYNQSFFLFTLGRALAGLGEKQAALEKLAQARETSNPAYDPPLHIRILNLLRDGYFAERKYLKAFEIKQERLSIEQQYQLRSFVGAGRLQPPKTVVNPALVREEEEEKIADEITASGRGEDVKRLIDRVGNHHTKLTVLHGQSGVGKSSLVQAGLIPAIEGKVIRNRQVLPVLQQVYRNWSGELGQCFSKALDLLHKSGERGKGKGEKSLLDSTSKSFESTTAILEQLRRNQYDFITVLIFDQFEEFFFIAKEPAQRKIFYEFLEQCLDIPQVKVILSLREDYLHYLLECNERLVSLDVINNNILDKKVLYYLGNFTPLDAKSIITNLTKGSQFPLESALIDKLVANLAEELSEVRPIELQVVGAQLQTEKITTLEKYQAQGTKNQLVGRFLGEVVKDCGEKHEKLAWLVLYLLTDENNTRPLKTRGDLELELEVKPEQLELVLTILVKSGLVLRVPALPTERYQLVHDYLVYFVRQQQPESAKLIKELEEERERRKLTEKKLIQTQKQKLKEARRATYTLIGLLVAVTSVALLTISLSINGIVFALSLTPAEKEGLDKLSASLNAAKKLKTLWHGTVSDTRSLGITQLQESISQVKELNRLEGHEAGVTHVNFSPDGQMLASGDEDGSVIIWSVEGKRITTLKGHKASINHVSFSPDGKTIASASEDGSIFIWNFTGEVINTLKGHEAGVNSVTFSADNQMLASGDEDGSVIIWSIEGEIINTLKGHKASVNHVSFSPDEKMIASVSEDDTVGLWSISGQEIKTIEKQFALVSANFSSDNQTLITANRYGKIKILTLDGLLIKNFYLCCGKVTNTSVNDSQKMVAFTSKENRMINFRFYDSHHLQDVPHRHTDKVTSIQLSPDSKILATASKDKTIKLWKTPLSKNIFISNNQDPVHNLSFSPDGEKIAYATDNHRIKISKRDGRLTDTFPGRSSSISFSQDNQLVATVGMKDKVQLLNLDTSELQTLDLELGENILTNFTLSSDGTTVAGSSSNNTITLWNSKTNRTKSLAGHNHKITGLIFSPDNKTLASASQDNTVKLWTRDGTLINTLEGHYSQINQIQFSPNSDYLITRGNDNFVKLWSRESDSKLSLLRHREKILFSRFSPDGQTIITSSYDQSLFGVLNFWKYSGDLKEKIPKIATDEIVFDPNNQIMGLISSFGLVDILDSNNFAKIATLRIGQSLAYSNPTALISFDPKGDFIAISNQENTTQLWNYDEKIITSLKGHQEAIQIVKISPNGQIIATASRDGVVKLWQRDGEEFKTLRAHSRKVESFKGHENGVKHLWFSPDNQKIITVSSFYSGYGGYNYTIKIWDLQGNLLKEIEGKSNLYESVKISSDRKKIAFINTESFLQIINQDKSLITSIENHKNWINKVIFSPDGKIIASASDDDTIKLWRRDGTFITTLGEDDNGHTGRVNNLFFSPDGKIIASASDDNTIKLWRRDGTFIKTLGEDDNGHTESVNDVVFSPDGKIIASASDDNTIKLWRRDGTFITTFKRLNGSVNNLAFSPDGRLLASTSGGSYSDLNSDGELNIWGIKGIFVKNGYLIKTLTIEGLQDVSFSPDGKTIASASEDGIEFLSLDLDKLLERGCEMIDGYLQNNPNLEDRDRDICKGVGIDK